VEIVRWHRKVACLLVITAGLSGTGCTYLHNRGNDAADLIDVGVTVSDQPQFAFYMGFLNILSLGYSNVDGTLYGLAERHAGANEMRQNAGGVLLWGSEQLGYRDFDPADAGSPEPYKVGVIGLIEGPGPTDGHVVNCPKLCHIGWIGLTLNCKFGELADFLLGWTTLDVMGDDRSRLAEPSVDAGNQ
jgi:hypothetical protein